MKNAADFAPAVRSARRVLLSLCGGMGDAIHALPAIRAIRRNCPDAIIDVIGTDGTEPIWIGIGGARRFFAITWAMRQDRVRRRRLHIWWLRLKAIFLIAATGYDVFIDLKPSDRTQIASLLSRARHRLGTLDISWKSPRPWFYSLHCDLPWCNQPAYRFFLEALRYAGFDVQDIELPGPLPPALFSAAPPVAGPYIHLSLWTTSFARELPARCQQQLIIGMRAQFPSIRLVLTCSDWPREIAALDDLLRVVGRQGIDVFAGTLSLLELASLMRGAVLHIGPDTGTLHLAWLCGCPTVSWFLNHDSLTAWAPRGARHRVLISAVEQSRMAPSLQGITASAITEAAAELMSGNAPADEFGWKFILPPPLT